MRRAPAEERTVSLSSCSPPESPTSRRLTDGCRQRRTPDHCVVSTKHGALGGLPDEPIHVFLHEKSFGVQRLRRSLDGFHVSLVIVVPLLERQPWISGLPARLRRARERNEGAAQAAEIRRARTGRAEIPSRVSAKRHADFHRSYAGHILSVAVRPRNEH